MKFSSDSSSPRGTHTIATFIFVFVFCFVFKYNFQEM